jgi:hypothetical protein
MITLKTPLTAAQVAAATRIHERLNSWKATDAALDGLATSMPGFDHETCLIKASAINQLYGTNVYALPRMAKHLCDVMSEAPIDDDLVERLAALPTDGKIRRHVSFASKFAHFFIDRDRFPIFDSYAQERLRFHLSGATLPTINPPQYPDYVAAHNALIKLCGLQCSGRELDRYLWVGGLYRAWSKNNNAPINVEIRGVFEGAANDQGIAADLATLAGRTANPLIHQT